MSLALWIAAIVLALAMLGSGSMKLIRSREQIVAMGMAYAAHFPPGAIKAIGALEVLAAIGLILILKQDNKKAGAKPRLFRRLLIEWIRT